MELKACWDLFLKPKLCIFVSKPTDNYFHGGAIHAMLSLTEDKDEGEREI